MGFKEILNRMSEKRREKKDMLKYAEEQVRVQKLIEDRTKSANERELERFMKEEREEQIKHELEFQRKKRQSEISFDHNPLDTPNVMHSDWKILKEKNQFIENNSNNLLHQKNIFKDNPSLFGL